MSPGDLLEALETIGNAPEGVDRLRGLIMKLAMLGSLLPDGCSRNDWTKSTIGDATDTMQPGFACSKKHQVLGGHVHLRTHNINTLGQFNTDLLVEIDPDKVDPNKASLREGDVLFNNTNSRELVGKSCVIPSDLPYGFSNHMTLLRPIDELDSRFLWVILRALWRTGYFEQTCKAWIGQAGVNTKQLAKIEIEYPPLAEQRRIVAKVDELMALLDDFERTRDERDARRAAFRDSALAALQNAEDAEAAHAAWSRIATNLADCITDPADIAPLRQTILQLAVRGRLVPQDPEDEAAENLTRLLSSARKEHESTSRKRKTIHIRDVDDLHLPFQIPQNWKWSRFGELVLEFRYGTSQKCNRDETLTPVLRIPNIRNGSIDQEDMKYSDLPESDRKDLALVEGDLLLIRSNGSTEIVGSSAVVSPKDEGLAYAGYLVRARILVSQLSSRYLHIGLSAPYTRKQIEIPIRTTSGVKNINTTEIANLLIPVPPLPEQRRIVAKFDELMAICDELEQRLTEAKAHQSAFAAAAVYHLDLAQETLTV